MNLFNKIGIEAYYATITLNIIIDIVESIYLMYQVKRKTNISFVKALRTLIKVALCTIIMVLGLSILNLFIASYSISRFMSIIYIIIYGVVGAIIYLFMTYKSNTITEIVGKEFVNKLLIKFRKLVRR